MGRSLLSLPSAVQSALSRGTRELRSRNIEIVITSTFRTRSEQQFLYNMFLRGNTAFPVAPPGQSRHQFGLAVDLVPVLDADLPQVVEVMRSVGFRWAGESDRVHFDFVLPLATRRVSEASARMPQAAFPRTQQTPMPQKTGGSSPPSCLCCL